MRVFILIFVVSLSACGFQLRGSGVSLDIASPIYMSTENQGLVATALRRSLGDQDLLADAFDANTLEVLVDREQTSRRTASVGADTRVRDVELLYSVRLNSRRDPEDTFTSETVQVRKEYTYDITGVLGSSDQEEVLYEEMRRDLVRRLRVRLAGLTREAG